MSSTTNLQEDLSDKQISTKNKNKDKPTTVIKNESIDNSSQCLLLQHPLPPLKPNISSNNSNLKFTSLDNSKINSDNENSVIQQTLTQSMSEITSNKRKLQSISQEDSLQTQSSHSLLNHPNENKKLFDLIILPSSSDTTTTNINNNTNSVTKDESATSKDNIKFNTTEKENCDMNIHLSQSIAVNYPIFPSKATKDMCEKYLISYLNEEKKKFIIFQQSNPKNVATRASMIEVHDIFCQVILAVNPEYIY